MTLQPCHPLQAENCGGVGSHAKRPAGLQHPVNIPPISDKLANMVTRFRTIALLIAMLWQSLLALSPAVAAERADDFGHLTMHAQSADHHHHEDQTVHQEDSGGAFQHHHADGGLNQAGMLALGWPHLVTFKPLSPAEAAFARVPTPDLEGLLRPPRHNA